LGKEPTWPLILLLLVATNALRQGPTTDEATVQQVPTGLCTVLPLQYTIYLINSSVTGTKHTKFLSDVEGSDI